jgi:hypothetical protein
MVNNISFLLYMALLLVLVLKGKYAVHRLEHGLLGIALTYVCCFDEAPTFSYIFWHR